MASASYVFTAAGATDVGGNPKKENQDTWLANAASGILAVFDGHGQYGLTAATLARDITTAGGSFADAEAAFRKSLLSNLDARASTDGDIVLWGEPMTGWSRSIRGGTTASVVRLLGRKLRCEYVGDSEVMVVDCTTGEFKVLTNDHSSTSVAEYERAMREATVVPNVFFDTLGGRFGYGRRPVFIKKDAATAGAGMWELNPAGGHYTSNVRGEWAAYVECGDTMLNMFRAIGDFGLKKCGVTCEPEVVEHILPAAGRSVVLVASDGLFDVLHYEAIRDCILASKTGTAEEITAAVLKLGLEKGKDIFGSGQDNTTVCVGILDGPAHPVELCCGEPVSLDAGGLTAASGREPVSP